MKSTVALSWVAVLAMLAQDVAGHGRLLVPPHRGYIGKLAQFSAYVSPNYDDHGLNAGGIGQTSGGKHGVCGDPYNGVRQHETGGTYAKFPQFREKVISGCYAPGATIDLQVQITANHYGYFEFGLCKLNALNDKETEECFQTLVQPNGQKDWKLPAGAQTFSMQYSLPAGVTCSGDSHCVLRWHYVGWNNPGSDINGQEHFWNCADIYISNTCGSNPAPSPSSPRPSSNSPPSPSAKPTLAPYTPKPSSSVAPQPGCGGCGNCYYAPTKACFVGWTKWQCDSVSTFKWCGAGSNPSPSSAPKPSPSKLPTPPPYKPTPSKTSSPCRMEDMED
jgi:hypothetical protein